MRRIFITICILTSFAVANAQWTKCGLPVGAITYSLLAQNEYLFLGTLTTGVFRSADNGKTWTEINTNITNKQIWSISGVDNTLFAGTAGGGLYRSTDNGATWTVSNSGISSTTIIRKVVKFDNKLFAASTNKGVYASVDDGATWQLHNTGITGLVAGALLVTDTDLFAAVMQVIYKYDAANKSWVKSSTGIPNNTVSSMAYYKDNTGAKKLFAGVSDIFVKSEDNGANWASNQSGLAKVPIATIAVVGSTVLVGNDYGVYSSSDFGTTWTDSSTGFPTASYATWLTANNENVYVLQGASLWKRPLSDYGVSGIVDKKDSNRRILTSTIVSENLKLNVDLPIDQIEIISVSGAIVCRASVNNSTIDVRNLNRGVYFIKAYRGRNILVDKFIKN